MVISSFNSVKLFAADAAYFGIEVNIDLHLTSLALVCRGGADITKPEDVNVIQIPNF